MALTRPARRAGTRVPRGRPRGGIGGRGWTLAQRPPHRPMVRARANAASRTSRDAEARPEAAQTRRIGACRAPLPQFSHRNQQRHRDRRSAVRRHIFGLGGGRDGAGAALWPCAAPTQRRKPPSALPRRHPSSPLSNSMRNSFNVATGVRTSTQSRNCRGGGARSVRGGGPVRPGRRRARPHSFTLHPRPPAIAIPFLFRPPHQLASSAIACSAR